MESSNIIHYAYHRQNASVSAKARTKVIATTGAAQDCASMAVRISDLDFCPETSAIAKG
jgi:hypothetical protein